MIEVIGTFFKNLSDVYVSFLSTLPPWIQAFINFFLLVLIIVVYSIIIWKFYRFISKRDPLGLNLNQYNKIAHSFLARVVTGVLYFIEYILLLPFLIFIVFSVFTFFLMMLSSNQEMSQILILSAIVIAAIRMLSYYKESLSQEVAKTLPFLLLTVSVLNPNSFVEAEFVQRTLAQLTQIPLFLSEIKYYLLFIIAIEIVLRSFDLVFNLLDIQDIEDDEDEEKKKEED